MENIITVLNSVNKKTNGDFYTIFGVIITVIASTIIFFGFDGLIFSPKDQGEGIIFFLNNLGVFLIHTVLCGIFAFIGYICFQGIIKAFYWFTIDLKNAFKEAIKENCNIKPRNKKSKSKVNFG